jgi:hypothetical protein
MSHVPPHGRSVTRNYNQNLLSGISFEHVHLKHLLQGLMLLYVNLKQSHGELRNHRPIVKNNELVLLLIASNQPGSQTLTS